MTSIATAAAPNQDILVASFYKFVTLEDPPALGAELGARARELALRGTVLLAREGINASIAGAADAVAALLDDLRKRPGFAPLEDLRLSHHDRQPFRRFKVKHKAEIVTLGQPDIAPAQATGVHVPPAQWNALIATPDVLLVDTRNDYEVRIGGFEGALDLELARFRDFPAAMDAALATHGARRVAMFCTGGIRCEKASAWLMTRGVEVYQLEGGILRYLEEVPASDSRWRGECFVFDERVALTAALTPGEHTLCHACRRPLSAADRAAPQYVADVSCPYCHAEVDAARRRAFAERHRQVALAAARGDAHLGAVMAAIENEREPAAPRPSTADE